MAAIFVRVTASRAIQGVWFWDVFLVDVRNRKAMWLGPNIDGRFWTDIAEQADL